MATELTGGCESCVHPNADLDPDTGARGRINPTFGPCPCERTPQEARASKQQRFEAFRAAGGLS